MIITLETDLQYTLNTATEIVGQQPYKKETKIDSIGSWSLTETLDGLKEFTFTVKSDEHSKANVLMERNISVPFLTPFNGIIIEKNPSQDVVEFKAVEDAWHFTRKKYKCHDKRRIRYTSKNWYNKLWRFRRQLEIPSKKLHDLSTGSDLINFPILFHTTDIELKVHARSDGKDILFTKTETDGTSTKLHHEIEFYDFKTGELWAWIEYPEIRSGQAEEFQMYFGNESATDQQNISGTWDDYLGGFSMIQHLQSNSVDSTSNNNDGTDTSITYVPGKISNAASFDAVNSKIDVGSGTSIDDIFLSNGWISTWINPKSDGEGSAAYVLEKGGDSGTGWFLQTRLESGGNVSLRFYQDCATTDGIWDTAVDIPINTWTRVDIVYNNSVDTNDPTIYINGVARTVGSGLTQTQAPVGAGVSDAAASLLIGNNTGQTQTFDGLIDNVKILKSPPNNISDLIKIGYGSENSPEDYIIIGQAEEYTQQADIIADSIIRSANRDMPILNTTPVSNLISLWRLDGDALDSKGSNNLTWTGNELYVKGKFNTEEVNKCVKFDGSSYLSKTTNSTLDFTTSSAFSIVGWIKFDNLGSVEWVAGKNSNYNGAPGYSIVKDASDNIAFWIRTNTPQDNTVTSNTKIIAGEWYHIACSFDGNTDRIGMKIYINGLLDNTGTTQTMTGSIGNAVDFTLGAESDAGIPMTGIQDDMRIYNKELSAKEISRLHTMTQSDIDIIQTKVQWKLGDGHVTTIKDLISLHKFDQVLTDSKDIHPFILKTGTETYSDVKYGKGLSLNTNHYFISENASDYAFEYTDPFSISLWFKGNTSATAEEILSKHNGSTGWRWGFNASDEIVFEVDDGTNSRTFTVTEDWRDDTLHHIALTYDGTATGCQMYRDGVAITTIANGTFPSSTIVNTEVLNLGATSAGGDTLIAEIDDLRFYNRKLSDTEIKRLREATDSGIDRIRDDFIPMRLLEIEFNHKNHLESLKKIAKELGVNIYFNSKNHKVYLKIKGKPVSPVFDQAEITKPNFNLNNVANVVNVVGAKDPDGLQKEKSFEDTNELKYNYEQTFTDNQIATDDTLNLIGTNIVEQLKTLQPDLTIKTKPDQFNRFDLQTGDTLNISELQQDLQGIFKIIKIKLTQNSVDISLSKNSKSTVQTAGNDISSLLTTIIKQIQDITIQPE